MEHRGLGRPGGSRPTRKPSKMKARPLQRSGRRAAAPGQAGTVSTTWNRSDPRVGGVPARRSSRWPGRWSSAKADAREEPRNWPVGWLRWRLRPALDARSAGRPESLGPRWAGRRGREIAPPARRSHARSPGPLDSAPDVPDLPRQHRRRLVDDRADEGQRQARAARVALGALLPGGQPPFSSRPGLRRGAPGAPRRDPHAPVGDRLRRGDRPSRARRTTAPPRLQDLPGPGLGPAEGWLLNLAGRPRAAGPCLREAAPAWSAKKADPSDRPTTA